MPVFMPVGVAFVLVVPVGSDDVEKQGDMRVSVSLAGVDAELIQSYTLDEFYEMLLVRAIQSGFAIVDSDRPSDLSLRITSDGVRLRLQAQGGGYRGVVVLDPSRDVESFHLEMLHHALELMRRARRAFEREQKRPIVNANPDASSRSPTQSPTQIRESASSALPSTFSEPWRIQFAVGPEWSGPSGLNTWGGQLDAIVRHRGGLRFAVSGYGQDYSGQDASLRIAEWGVLGGVGYSLNPRGQTWDVSFRAQLGAAHQRARVLGETDSRIDLIGRAALRCELRRTSGLGLALSAGAQMTPTEIVHRSGEESLATLDRIRPFVALSGLVDLPL